MEDWKGCSLKDLGRGNRGLEVTGRHDHRQEKMEKGDRAWRARRWYGKNAVKQMKGCTEVSRHGVWQKG